MTRLSTGAQRRHLTLARSLFATTVLSGMIGSAYAQTVAPTEAAKETKTLETVVVTGFRASLDAATKSKRDAVGFTDSISAEDIGKFPDNNIAEAINRIPGVTLTREITGEGLQVQIRGLGSSFTRVLFNGAPVASASTGRTDGGGANREVDLDFLPAELMSRVTVTKSPTADLLEGGAAGVVDMRSARPFDKKGLRSSFSLEGTRSQVAAKWGDRASAVVSNTWGDTLGVLGGISLSQNKSRTVGFETIGWTNANLSATQSSATARNTTGGGNWTIPGTVPANAGNGLTTGEVINEAFLLAHNPGANITQIDNGLIPRLGRNMEATGTRDRYTGLLSLEFRPGNGFKGYLDTVIGHKTNEFERVDMNWIGRNGASVPLNLSFDKSDCSGGCTVTKGTFANAQYFLEYRPYVETTKFRSVNPGFEWQLAEKLKLDAQANLTQSEFHRASPSVLMSTKPSSGITVNYDNSSGSGSPLIMPNVNLNDPSLFGWNSGSRLNVQEEKRKVQTKGVRGNLTWGDEDFNIKGGAAYDDVYRRITSLNNDAGWQGAACGSNLSTFLPGPNTTSPSGCNGTTLAGGVGAAYPGYGSGLTAGNTTPLTVLGAAIPAGKTGSYLVPGPQGFVTVDWARFAKDSNYDYFHNNALVTNGNTNTGTSPGYLQEKTTGFYTEVTGRLRPMDHLLRYNLGVRYVRTEQIFGTEASVADPRNAAQALGDGGRYPNMIVETLTPRTYNNVLPSGNLVFSLRDDLQARLSASRSMTRPNPTDLRATSLSFSDPSAANGTLSNSDLKPYISTNYDLGLEWYTGKEGYVSAAYFSKDISAFTAAQNSTVPFSALAQYGVTYATLSPTQQVAIDTRGGPGAANVTITQNVNSDGILKIRGWELSWVQPLDKVLPIPGFGFASNYTRVKQSANVSGFVALGVPAYTYNLTAFYEKHGVMVRLSQTFSKGSQVANAGQNGIGAAALYGDDYKQLDMSTRFDVGDMLGWKHDIQLSFDVNNLAGAKQRAYFQFSNATFTEYAPGRTYVLGLRAKF